MARSIPPRTMSSVARERHASAGGRQASTNSGTASVERTVTQRVRQWRYQTRPVFKRVREPLVDVFQEAEEVLVIVDLGGFARGEISLSLTPEHYVVEARRGEQWFKEVIDLPLNVDVERAQERLVNGMLEIVLPRRKVTAQPTSGRSTRER